MRVPHNSKDAPQSFWRSVRQGRGRWGFLRPIIDATVALGLFMFVSMAVTSAPSSANPHNPGPAAQYRSMIAPAVAQGDEQRTIVEIATTSSEASPDAVYRRTSFSAAFVLLSLAFSIIVAFNLAFFRHMRRAYATGRGGKRLRDRHVTRTRM